MIQSEFALVILLCLLRLSGNLVRYYVDSMSEVKFLNESSCMSYTNCLTGNDGSDRCGTSLGRHKSDDGNGTSMCVRKKRTWHLFETGLSPDAEETSRF